MKTKIFTKKTASLLLAITILFVSVLTLFSCGSSIGGKNELLSEAALRENVSAETKKSFDTVAEYLDYWDFPSFSMSKIEALERLYRSKFVSELPSPETKARETAEYFLDYFYAEDFDIENTELTTDYIVYSFVETMGDKYSVYRTKSEYEDYSSDMSGSFVGIGVSVRYSVATDEILVESVYEDSGAMQAGILAGDYITKVNGDKVSDVGYETAINNIKGKEGSTVVITVLRDGEEIDITVTRKKIVEKTVTYDIKSGIAYIKITGFKSNTARQFEKAVDEAVRQNAKGIIYDLRGNLGGYLDSVVDMLDYIAPKGTTLVSFTNDYGDPLVSKKAHSVSLPTVVLCNGNTASAGELFTAGIRDFETLGFFESTLVGELTYGKGIMKNTYLFSDNSSITMTVAYYNPPCGINYHGVGITPDVLVEGENEQLTKAYEELNKLINKQ